MRSAIGIATDSEGVTVVLCSDGTVWRMIEDGEYRKTGPGFGDGHMVSTGHWWAQVPHGPIPGTAAHEKAETAARSERDGIPF